MSASREAQAVRAGKSERAKTARDADRRAKKPREADKRRPSNGDPQLTEADVSRAREYAARLRAVADEYDRRCTEVEWQESQTREWQRLMRTWEQLRSDLETGRAMLYNMDENVTKRDEFSERLRDGHESLQTNLREDIADRDALAKRLLAYQKNNHDPARAELVPASIARLQRESAEKAQSAMRELLASDLARPLAPCVDALERAATTLLAIAAGDVARDLSVYAVELATDPHVAEARKSAGSSNSLTAAAREAVAIVRGVSRKTVERALAVPRRARRKEAHS